jgi:cytochrome c oxidase subunit 2
MRALGIVAVLALAAGCGRDRGGEKFVRLFPDQASTVAGRVDALFYFLCAISIAVTLAIVGIIFFYAVRYRHRPERRAPYQRVGVDARTMRRIEVAWIGIPLVIFLGIFYWGASVGVAINTPPEGALEVFVVGKQWMWKVQHMSGRREINELHVPLGQPVKLLLTSEDVIHSFYVPAFRVKTDVLPGRYTILWFEPTRVGEFHLFCAEYCGTKHSQMIGSIVVMEPRDYQGWLSEGASVSLSAAGERLFTDLGCSTCHQEKATGRGPPLRGLYGSTVRLQGGDEVVADEGYIRESIVEPQKRVVAGYQPVMPSYGAQLDEERIIQLLSYIRSLTEDRSEARDAGSDTAPDAGSDPAVPDASAEGPDASLEPSDAGAAEDAAVEILP